MILNFAEYQVSAHLPYTTITPETTDQRPPSWKVPSWKRAVKLYPAKKAINAITELFIVARDKKRDKYLCIGSLFKLPDSWE